MAKEGNHHIEEQIINLTINGSVTDEEIRDLQQNFIYYYKEYIGSELQRIFDELVPPDVYIQIDSLEINLGALKITQVRDLERVLRRIVREKVEPQIRSKVEAVRRQAAAKSKKTGGGSKKGFSTMNILEHLLTKGHYPSWASRENGTMDDILDQMLDKKPKVLWRTLVRLGKDKKAMERLYQQFSLPRLERILELVYGKQQLGVKKRLRQLKKRLKATDKVLVAAAIQYLLETGSASGGPVDYQTPAFDRSVVEAVQQRKGGAAPASKVRSGFQEAYSDVQIIGYFLEHGAIPMWADVESKRALHELLDDLLERKLVPLQRVIERRAEQPRVLRRLVLQFKDEQLVQLLTPASEETTNFVQQTFAELNFLTRSRQQIEQPITAAALREIVFTEALEVFFVEKKSRLVKKRFLRRVLERLAGPTRTPYTTLVKESYKTLRRKQGTTPLRQALEQLDGQLQEKIQQEREELRTARREYRNIERKIERLLEKREKGTLSPPEATQLRQLQRQAQQIEQTIEALDDADRPLEIERVTQERQRLQQQLRTAATAEQNQLQQRLESTNQSFRRLQQTLQKEVKNLLRDKEKLNTLVGSIAEQRIKRVNNRLTKYHRAVQTVIAQLRLDQTDLTTFLGDINRTLRTDISTEEKQRLRKERSRLQQQLIEINETIATLESEEEALNEALVKTIKVVEGEREDDAVTGTTKMDLLLFRLQYGATPWWAEELPRQSIEELVLEFARETPRGLRSAFLKVGKYPVVWERLVNQVSNQAFRELVVALFPSDSQVILGQVELLRTLHFSQAFASLKTVDAKAFQWSAVIEYLLTNRQSFNTQDFVREVVLQTARTHALSPTKLLELTNNVATNRKAELGAFLEWNNVLLKDPATGTLERELIERSTEQQQKEEGTFLNPDQKLELIVEFFSTGRFTKRALALNLTTQAQFETLLLEQMQTNRARAAEVLGNLIRLSNARAFIVNNLSDYFFWEIAHLVKPQATLPAKRIFQDLAVVQSGTQLRLEKELLLNYFIGSQPAFETDVYVRQLLAAVQQRTGRTPLAIVTEWKRALKAGRSSLKSSLLLAVVQLEVGVLKEEEKKAQDLDLKANLTERIEGGAQEYNRLSTALSNIVAQETAERQAAADQRDYTYEALRTTIDQQQTELTELERTLREEPPASALELLELERRVRQYRSVLAQLRLQLPPILRKLEHDIERRQRSLTGLRRRAERRTDSSAPVDDLPTYEAELETLVQRLRPRLSTPALETQVEQVRTLLAELQEAPPEEAAEQSPRLIQLREQLADLRTQAIAVEDETLEDPNPEPSLVERKAEVLEWLEMSNPYAFEVLPQLLADLKGDDAPHALFFNDVQAAATELRDERLGEAILNLLEREQPDITPIAELQRMEDLDDRQAALLDNFNQRAPVELWKAWEELEAYFEEEPEALTPPRQRLQRLIQQAIRRREQQNIRAYVSNLRTAQQTLARRLDQAYTVEALNDVQEALDGLWQQQQAQAEELVRIARDEESRRDYERLRRNVDRVFTNLQNRRRRRATALVQDEAEAVQEQITSQEASLQTLEERRNLEVQRLEDQARRRKAAPPTQKKKSRPKPPPTPAPIDEPLQIYNAGMVLLYPFIARLFGMLGYVKKREFVDEAAQHKGIHILQYLVTGRTEAPEHELLLNKIFCGYPIVEPVPFGIEFTEKELQTGESLLAGVIQNWPKMKNMSPNSLRGSFLARPGTLKEEETQWQVSVPKQTFDILLKSLPWGYNFIRFPWSEKFITVDWKIM